jgi:capsular polysaccharide transport system permease protein
MNKQMRYDQRLREAARLGQRVRDMFRLSRAPRSIFSVAFGLSLLAAVYWLLIASDFYVSEAHVIIQKTEINAAPSIDFASLLGNTAPSSADQLLLRDHLLSTDMLGVLEAKLHLREHYSDWRRDPLSRIWFSGMPVEKFQAYFRDRVTVDFDEYTGVLVIRAQAFDAPTAQAIAAEMVAEGERHMNGMGHALAREQVAFLEREVQALNERATAARQAVLDFQNRNNLASPASATETLQAIIARLEGQLTELQTRRSALLGYLVPGSPSIQEVDLQIDAVRNQLEQEGKRLASPEGNTLNRTLEQYQRLELEAGFAQDLYRTALAALERGRIEATRTLKKVSVLQSPLLPEYPLQPRRLYNATVFLVLSLLVAGMLNLVIVIVRDHRD